MPTLACTPILPLAQVLGGTLLLAPVALVPVVAVKAAVFARRERRMSAPAAAASMVWANVVSSVVGFVMVLPYFAPASWLGFGIAAGALAVMAWLPGARLAAFEADDRPPWLPGSAGGVVGLVCGLTVLTWVAFGLSQYVLEWTALPRWVYWGVKYAFVVTGIAGAMIVTIVWEEWAVGRGWRRAGEAFYDTVLEANLAAFALAALVGAVLMVPERLGEPGFLALLFAGA